MTLPPELKKAEKTLSDLYSECIQAAGDEVLRGTNDWTNLQQTKLIPSRVVASFLETKELVLMRYGCEENLTQDINGVNRRVCCLEGRLKSDVKKYGLCGWCKFVVAVFGGERK